MTNAEARFNNSLRPRKPEGSLGRTAQDVHLNSHTAPELCSRLVTDNSNYTRHTKTFIKETFVIASVACASKIKPKSFQPRRNVFFFCFLPEADAYRVYVHAWVLCCFHSFTSTKPHTPWRLPKPFVGRRQHRWTAARR